MPPKAAEDYETFNRESNLKGPISDAINRAAAELKANPKRKKSIGNRLAQELRDIVRTPDGGGKEAFAKSFSGDSRKPAGFGHGVVWPEESLVERFAKAYESLGYATYRPSPSIRDMVLRAYRDWVEVERYAKWSEDDKRKHPRGQPGNPGQFAPKDSASGSESTEKENREPLKNLFTKVESSLQASSIHQFRTKDSAFKAASATKPEYDALLDEGTGLDKRLGATTRRNDKPGEWAAMLKEFETGESKGPVVILAPIKSEASANKKMMKYRGNWGYMKDLVRGTVAVDSIHDIKGTIDEIREEMASQGWSITERPNNRFGNPTPDGYRDVQLLITKEGGITCELQINTKAMIAAKEGRGHELYEQIRNVTRAAHAEGRTTTAEEVKQLAEWRSDSTTIYTDAWKKSGGE